MNEKYDLQIYELQADICKTLAQPKRLMIIHELRMGQKSVGQLAASLRIPQPNVSQHLSTMRKHGIVIAHRQGTTIYYGLASQRIGEACDLVRMLLKEQLEKGKDLATSLSAEIPLPVNGPFS